MKPGPRLYLDVTSACQSALNTGVKRMQRGLHAWLKQFPNCTPVYWQSVRRDYRTLGAQDEACLELTDSRELRGFDLYDAPFLSAFISDGRRFWSDRPRLLGWPEKLQQGDVVFVPDLLWDNRSGFFQRMKKCQAKRIGVFHDAIGLRRPEQSQIDRILCARGVRALSNFDLVLCISHEAEADLKYFWKKFGLPVAPTHIAPWPVPFAGNRPEHAANFSARSVLYVARLEAHKNHLRLLDACEMLWAREVAFKLRLIGCNSYPSYSRQVSQRVDELRKKGRDVELRAHVSEQELHDAYRDCSFTVFPSLLEGFGLPIIESLWHGRPVVCSATGAIGEVAAGGGCEAINPQQTEGMARAMESLLTDKEHYQNLYRQIQGRPLRQWVDYWQELAPFIDPVCQR